MNPDDEAAFRAFVAARSTALLHTARLLTADAHAAEDLVQETLARLVPRWRRLDDPEAGCGQPRPPARRSSSPWSPSA
jgi:DNA-directed RNA polymerase specialized sigma24 family protein